MTIRPLFRVKKADAAELYKYISHFNISFNPWSSEEYKLGRVKEFWRHVSAPRFKKVNPDLKVNVDLHHRMIKPVIAVKYIDGTEEKFCTQMDDLVEIFSDIHLHAALLQSKEVDEETLREQDEDED